MRARARRVAGGLCSCTRTPAWDRAGLTYCAVSTNSRRSLAAVFASRWIRQHTGRAIEWGVRIRVRLFDFAYGDQALFVRRTVFEELEGYRELPLMEDVDFIR